MERRNCCIVIKEMLEHIPKEEREFIYDLNWNYKDALYKPPEETLQWERTGKTLEGHIPFPSVHEWQLKILSIFMVKTIDELKALWNIKNL